MAVLAHAAAAASGNREKWIVGRWTASAPQRPDRIVVFHSDHSWSVEGYIPSSSNTERLITREDIRGRRWHLAGDKLILRYPNDHGFETYPYKIVSFSHDKIVTDIFTYTRAK
jgi:hypothetical protein